MGFLIENIKIFYKLIQYIISFFYIAFFLFFSGPRYFAFDFHVVKLLRIKTEAIDGLTVDTAEAKLNVIVSIFWIWKKSNFHIYYTVSYLYFLNNK